MPRQSGPVPRRSRSPNRIDAAAQGRARQTADEVRNQARIGQIVADTLDRLSGRHNCRPDLCNQVAGVPDGINAGEITDRIETGEITSGSAGEIADGVDADRGEAGEPSDGRAGEIADWIGGGVAGVVGIRLA